MQTNRGGAERRDRKMVVRNCLVVVFVQLFVVGEGVRGLVGALLDQSIRSKSLSYTQFMRFLVLFGL